MKRQHARQHARQLAHELCAEHQIVNGDTRDLMINSPARHILPSAKTMQIRRERRAQAIKKGIIRAAAKRDDLREAELEDMKAGNKRIVTPDTLNARREREAEDEKTTRTMTNVFGDIIVFETSNHLDIDKPFNQALEIEAEAALRGLIGAWFTVTSATRASTDNTPDSIAKTIAEQANDAMKKCKPELYIRHVAPQSDRTPHCDFVAFFKTIEDVERFEKRLEKHVDSLWKGTYTAQTIPYIFKRVKPEHALAERAWASVWGIKANSTSRFASTEKKPKPACKYYKNHAQETALWRNGKDLAAGRDDLNPKRWDDLRIEPPDFIISKFAAAIERGIKINHPTGAVNKIINREVKGGVVNNYSFFVNKSKLITNQAREREQQRRKATETPPPTPPTPYQATLAARTRHLNGLTRPTPAQLAKKLTRFRGDSEVMAYSRHPHHFHHHQLTYLTMQAPPHP